ncbi:MAG TPA: RNA pseudouridine synthase [Mycobacteriales bacterium]|nr:RNA pseudouridine synthase [Mycobacteriales bacterium]
MTGWNRFRDELVILDNEAVLALNKPPGISVMGERHSTDLVRLAQDAGERLFPVHRIDKVTSGAVLFAKDLSAHADLTRQFTRRTVDKVYLAVTRSSGLPSHGTIDLPLLTASSGRVRVAAQRDSITADPTGRRWSVPPSDAYSHTRTYPSLTTFAMVWTDGERTLLVVRPVTGRRHQIRVHLAWIGHPVNGDPLFDRSAAARGDRTCLHSWRLCLRAGWAGGAPVRLEAAPGPDFWAVLRDRLTGEDPSALLDRASQAVADLPAHTDSGGERP